VAGEFHPLASNLRTFQVEPAGGLIENLPPLIQGTTLPGSLLVGQNCEPALGKGYARINGHTKYSTTALTGSGSVLGAFPFANGVIGCRGTNIEFGTGGTWTSLSTTRTAAKKYRAHRYNWTSEKIILVDSSGYPARYDGTTLDELDSVTDTFGATSVTTFKRHMVFTNNQMLVISAPGDETDYSGTNGAAIINIGREIYALKEWRGSLYLFGPNHICKLTGNNSTDWAVEPVTEKLGCIAPDSIQEIGGDILYLAADGLRSIAGTQRIGDVGMDLLTEAIDSSITDVIKNRNSKVISSLVIPSKNQYRLFYSASGETAANSKGILGGFRLDPTFDHQGQAQAINSWEWFTLKGMNVACCDWFINDGAEVIIHGDHSGIVHKQEVGFGFDGANVAATLQFPYWSYDDPEIRKTLHKIRMVMFTEGNTSVTLLNDLEFGDTTTLNPTDIDVSASMATGSVYGTAVYGTGTYSTDVLENLNFNLIGSAKNHALTLSSDDILAPWILKTMFVQYATRGSRY
jgi:hypothetical protein